MGSFSFSKAERLLKRRDFVNVNRFGKRRHSHHFIVLWKENRSGITRLGITASKKIGSAVERNKVKRLIREFFRLHKSCLPGGYDLVFVAKKGSSNLDYREAENEICELFTDKRRLAPCKGDSYNHD